jgi:hypothetical protein
VDPDDLPGACLNYTGDTVRKLIALCKALADLNRNGGLFFLSSHEAAQRVGVVQPVAYRLLMLLVRDGVLKVMQPGNQRRATRYKWIGGAQ